MTTVQQAPVAVTFQLDPFKRFRTTFFKGSSHSSRVTVTAFNVHQDSVTLVGRRRGWNLRTTKFETAPLSDDDVQTYRGFSERHLAIITAVRTGPSYEYDSLLIKQQFGQTPTFYQEGHLWR